MNKDQAGLIYHTFIVGEAIDLVVLTEEIAEKSNWFNWFNDEEPTRNMQKHYYPNTPAGQARFFREEIDGNPTKLQLGILNKQHQILIGIVSLSNIDFHHRRCELGLLVGEKKYQNLKTFTETTRLIIRHAFDQLNMNRIHAGTITKELSELFVRVMGFSHIGVIKNDIFKNGKFNDIYLVSLLQEDYRKKHPVS